MASEGFRLPRSSYSELVKIIRAYAQAPKNSSPKAVGDLAGVHQTVVSRNNAFLAEIGVIEGRRYKTVSEPVSYTHLRAHET